MDDELAVTEMLDFVDFNAERAAQEAAEDELLLFGMEFEPGQRSIDD